MCVCVCVCVCVCLSLRVGREVEEDLTGKCFQVNLVPISPRQMNRNAHQHRAAGLTTATQWEKPQCPSMDERINIMWINTMESYSALKRKEILTHATTWVNLEDIMRGERSQTQKVKYGMIPRV